MKITLEIPDDLVKALLDQIVQKVQSGLRESTEGPSGPNAFLAASTKQLPLGEIPSMSVRAFHILAEARRVDQPENRKILTIEDLCRKTLLNLCYWKNCGKATAKFIDEALRAQGLRLDMTDVEIEAYREGRFTP